MPVMVNLIPIPAGVRPDGGLSVSLVIAPRLTGGVLLGEFPDLLDWTARLAAGQPSVTFRCGAVEVGATVELTALRPDLWDALFDENTPVEPFTFDDYRNRVVVSYRTRDAVADLRERYQEIMVNNPAALPGAELTAASLSPFALPDEEPGALDRALADRRRRRFFRQRDPERVAPGLARSQGPTEETAHDFALYHRMPIPSEDAPDPLPRTRNELERLFDFHKAITALSSYPLLQRVLGLVLDLRIPADAVRPAGEAGFPLGELSVGRFEPGGGWRGEVGRLPTSVLYRYSPGTGAGIFCASEPPAPNPVVAEGFLALYEDRYHVLDLDVDGAMTKVTNLATMMRDQRRAEAGGGALPALRSAGLALAVDDRGSEVVAALASAASIDAAMTGAGNPAQPLTAADLVRGYRVDVWSSVTRRWHSLHRRHAVYRVGHDPEVKVEGDEEGFVQFAAASPAEDRTRLPRADGTPPVETDLYVHERLAHWTGWSLSAPKPGKPINRAADADQALEDDNTADEVVTAFAVRPRYRPAPGSLPRLRFGTSYRFRVRVVDLAGNGPGFDPREIGTLSGAPVPVSLPLAPAGKTYLRYEPVPHPLLVLRRAPTAGRPALDRLVIRSFNDDPSKDATPTSESDERHVAPPRTSGEMAETHGMLDGIAGQLKGDPATFAMVVERNDAKFGTVTIGDPPTEIPIEPAERLRVDYLPDPLARMAAFKDLPGVAEGLVVRAGSAGTSADEPDPERRAGPVVLVHFGDEWPDRRAFRLVLIEGNTVPQWDPATRSLTVSLSKSGSIVSQLSSSLSEADLTLLGVWAWQREYLDALATQTVAAGGEWLSGSLEGQARLAGELARLALEGRQWSLTPAIPVKLVHAVQQPIGHPAFFCGTNSPVPLSERPGDLLPPPDADPHAALTAWREPGSPDATLIGGLQTHYASTGRIDIHAAWADLIDDAPNGVREVPERATVEPILMGGPPQGDIPAQGKNRRSVARYRTLDGLLEFVPQRRQAGVLLPTAAPVHRLGDSRHRTVSYRAVATSRFQDDFPAGQDLVFTRASQAVTVEVPSSARPVPPKVVSLLPTFGWRRESAGTVKTSIRLGRGIRVYLERPWFASGAGELLGVVLWPTGRPTPSDQERRDRYGSFVTQWGLDPTRRGGRLPPMPRLFDLPEATATGRGIRLPEADMEVDVTGHPVQFDADRGLWYSEITLSAEAAYRPFVRLALARFQPHSIRGAEVSSVTLADFIQLTPDRSAVLIADPDAPWVFRLVVSGLAPSPPMPRRHEILVTVEHRRPDVTGDLGWEEASPADVQVTEVQPSPGSPAVLFSGVVQFASAPPKDTMRLVLREYEYWEVDPPDPGFARPLQPYLERATLARASTLRSERLEAVESRFALTERVLGRLNRLVIGPELRGRLVYSEIIPVDPPAFARDEPAVSAVGMVQPPEDVEGEPEDPPWPALGGPAPLLAADWSGLPELGPDTDPRRVRGEVKLAQAMLNATAMATPPLAIDGNFGPATEAALANFRAALLLPPGNTIEAATWISLAIAAPFPQLEPGLGQPPMQGPPIMLVQRLLNVVLGQPIVAESGIYSPQTAARVQDLQTMRGLPPTGLVGVETWLSLLDLMDSVEISGVEEVALDYDVDRADGGGELLIIGDRTALDDAVVPTSAPLNKDWGDRSGFWFELHDAAGRPLFRRLIGTMPEQPHEVPFDPDTEEPWTRSVEARRQMRIMLQVPVIAVARTLAVFGSRDGRLHVPAELLASFQLS